MTNRLILLERPIEGDYGPNQFVSMLVVVDGALAPDLVESTARAIAADNCGWEGRDIWFGEAEAGHHAAHFTELGTTQYPVNPRPLRKFIGDYVCR